MTAFVRVCATTLVFTAMAFTSAPPVVAQGTIGAPSRPRTGQGQFDFTDADIRSVISAIATAGDLDVVFGDIPPRTVSLRTRTPVNREGYLSLLRSVATANGLRVSEDGSLITIAAVAPPQQRQPNEQPIPFENAELFVYRLKHSNAGRLASVLQAIFSGGGVPAGQQGLRQQTLSNQVRNQFRGGANSGGFGGGGGFGVGGGFGGGGGFGTGGGFGVSAGQGGVFQRQGQAGVVGQGGAATGALAGQVIIVPEEATNTLLIRADPADWDIIRQAIDAVDLRPLQVLIEVMIAEVRRSDDLKVGVNVSGSNARNSSGRVEASGSTSRASVDSSAGSIFNFTRYGAVDINVALSALKSRGNVRILSLPLVFAQNNQESRLLVGTQRPFIQSQRTLATDNAARDQVVQYRDVGTSLAILPTINQDGYVNLLVQQEVSSATNEIQFGAPVISTREASATLFVKDGQTVVVGGLTDNQEEKIRSGIPGLSNLPGVGWLFGSTQKNNVRTELFLFLTPHIVQIDADVDRIRKEIQEKAPLLQQMPVTPLITSPMDSTAPKYPKIEEPQRRQNHEPEQPVRRTPGGMRFPFPGNPQPGQPVPQPIPVPVPVPQPQPQNPAPDTPAPPAPPAPPPPPPAPEFRQSTDPAKHNPLKEEQFTTTFSHPQ